MLNVLIIATLAVGLVTLLGSVWPAIERARLRRRRARRPFRRPRLRLAAFLESEPATGDAPEVFPAAVAPAAPVRTARERVLRTDQEWRSLLTPEQYEVTRRGATERPYSGRFWDHHEDGVYHCVACGTPLFDAGAKFDAANGWPSFRAPVAPDALAEMRNISYGIVRTAVTCRRCESRVGHVFPDGPRPTGLRYSVNSAALAFVSREGADPLRRRAE